MVITRGACVLGSGLALAAVPAPRAQEVKQLDPKVKLCIPYQDYTQEDHKRVLALFGATTSGSRRSRHSRNPASTSLET